jgi:hypothetical protein
LADWATISSLATAGGTLVLAIATFGSIRSANRAARVAERSLMAQQRPLLIPSREDDLTERIRFGDGFVVEVKGHGSTLAAANGNLYLAMGLRNGGNGLGVLHGWRAEPWRRTGEEIRPDLDAFRRLTRDLYIPAGSTGFWQGAIRNASDPDYEWIRAAITRGERISIDLLYGDLEGGQRTIARFVAVSDNAEGDDRGRDEVIRYWNVDGSDPR